MIKSSKSYVAKSKKNEFTVRTPNATYVRSWNRNGGLEYRSLYKHIINFYRENQYKKSEKKIILKIIV